MKFFIPLLLLMVWALPAIAARPHNIFDDDWTPPKTAQTPRPPTTVKPSPTESTTVQPKETTPAIAPSTARLAIPTPSVQAAVRKVMKEVYAEQLADRAIPARRKLTKSLLTQADKSKDAPVDRFVLLAAAIDSAIDAANLTAAFRAADEMSETFDVDSLGIKADAALRFGPKSAVPDSAADNVSVAIELAHNLARVEDFTTAARVSAALQPATVGNPALRTKLQQCQRDVSVARDSAEHFIHDQARLKAAPEDPTANLAVGRYLCFVKGQWQEGLPMLTKGSDAALKLLAAQEIANPATPEDLSNIADNWWNLAVKRPDSISRATITAHSVALYERALKDMTGLRKMQIQKRLAEIAAAARGATELLPGMQGKSSASNNGIVLLKSGDKITTLESYKTPVAFRIVLQTESTDFRISYAADQIVFNWEYDPNELRIDGGPADKHYKKGAGSVPKKTWVTIDLVVQPDSMTISVDGEERDTIKADFSKINQPLSILSHSSPLVVKSVQMSRP